MRIEEMTKPELEAWGLELKKEYESYKAKNLKLNMARGKPSDTQLDLSVGMLNILNGDYIASDGTDVRNYGLLEGIPEARELFADILGTTADNVIIGGNSSLNIMFDTVSRAMFNGVLPGSTPWIKQGEIKFVCPAPGYDRHFTICEYFGIEMIKVDMLSDGPDMDQVESLVVADAAIKGIWCVPMYSNPDGITYSDAVVSRLAGMKTAAPDFRIFWDNAYCLHHLDKNDKAKLLNIYDVCKEMGNEDRVYMFSSTSKVTFPGAGISAIAASSANIAHTKNQLASQTISYNKIDQMAHCKFLRDIHGVNAHMEKHAVILKPKFDAVASILSKELADLGCASWTNPKGGYFISLNTLDGCAKRVVQLCKEVGVVLTGAGATYPYGKDPRDRNIRIAPSFPPLAELVMAMELLCLCVKMASVEKFLAG